MTSTNIIYIPIGIDCSVAYNLDRLGLRTCALPFDWLRIIDINTIIKLLDSNFQFFLDEEYFEEVLDLENNLINISKKFPVEQDDIIDFNKIGNKHPIIINKKLGIKFVHDFESFSDIDFKKVLEKYKRRINKLYELLNNKDIHKVFVRLSKNSKDNEIFNKFIEEKGYQNCSLVHILVTNKIIKQCSSWKKEELDWEYYLFIL
jgi:hypothetical protein